MLLPSRPATSDVNIGLGSPASASLASSAIYAVITVVNDNSKWPGMLTGVYLGAELRHRPHALQLGEDLGEETRLRVYSQHWTAAKVQ